ncbi:hypothetical protein E0Z10_g2920 [Xylaria hypoxylon]|uniref:Uncharacterized protein n=1 Tax=Xylaria hypoxylon TaxID=37992 RepID=A0A4Z0ZB42_9PEZI|nr:hypothetical protein E0Z10_g2920 [Xylaria hypoxylon]
MSTPERTSDTSDEATSDEATFSSPSISGSILSQAVGTPPQITSASPQAVVIFPQAGGGRLPASDALRQAGNALPWEGNALLWGDTMRTPSSQDFQYIEVSILKIQSLLLTVSSDNHLIRDFAPLVLLQAPRKLLESSDHEQ